MVKKNYQSYGARYIRVVSLIAFLEVSYVCALTKCTNSYTGVDLLNSSLKKKV